MQSQCCYTWSVGCIGVTGGGFKFDMAENFEVCVCVCVCVCVKKSQRWKGREKISSLEREISGVISLNSICVGVSSSLAHYVSIKTGWSCFMVLVLHALIH